MENENATNSPVGVDFAPLKADLSVLEHVNLATLQNGLGALRDLRLENTGDETLENIVCKISSDDGFIVPGQIDFEEIRAGETIERHEVEVLLNQRKILEKSGAPSSGAITMTVTAGGRTVCERRYPMTILAPNQWIGIEPAPELLASYVMTGDDFIVRVQNEAAAAIEEATGRAALDGYNGGKKRVREICAAICAALDRLVISVSPSTEPLTKPGLRLRTPSEIERDKRCTSQEAALLTAAVMEKCGLHPVLIVTMDSCIVACHLIDTFFEDVVIRNFHTIHKRIELDELAIVGAGAAGGSPAEAGENAAVQPPIAPESFICAVDVLRSRDIGINSLQFVVDGLGNPNAKRSTVRLQPSAITPHSRIERWTQKLLDFSARNRLLNIPKTSRQVIHLMCSNIADLEDKIAANKTISIRSIAESMGEKALDNLQNGSMASEECRAAIDAELEKHRLCVMMPQREVRRRLSDLMHDARTDLEESGTNTLFLTIGELQWMEAGVGANRKTYRAPILMVPVRLERSSMSEGVKMYRLDEDTTVNTTLLEFMRSQFGISVPDLDPLPMDDSGVDVPQVMQIFRESVEGLRGWEVFEEATIGCFSFGKFVMWKDMTERAEELKRSPLVNHLIGGGGNFEDGVDVFPASDVASHIEPGELFCPVSYDSSQLTAVLYSEMGKSFVLHGPPGTGKSQTITNIIAHNLAKGRRVLFVSEKKAALDVVKDRLDRIGLTPFCLELHSNKTEKSRFYAQIKDALDVPETSSPDEWDRIVADFIKCRAELDGYVKALHKQYPNGLTAYNCFASAMTNGGKAQPQLIAGDCLAQTREEYRDARQAVQDLIDDFRSVSDEALAAIPKLKSDAWSPTLESGLRDAADALAPAAKEFAESIAPVAGPLGIAAPEKQLAEMIDVLAALKNARKTNRRVFAESGKNTAELLKELIGLCERHEKCAAELSSYKLEKLAELDFDGIAARLSENAGKFFIVKFFANRALANELSGIVKTGAQKLTAEKLSQDLPKMRELVSLERTFREKSDCAIDEMVDVSDDFRAAAATACEKWEAFRERLDKFCEFADDGVRSLAPAEIEEMCGAVVDNVSDLRNVMRYRKTVEHANGFGVGAFAAYIAENDDGNLDVLRVFDDAYAAKMLAAILAATPELAEFSGLSHDGRIAKFRELDARCTELSRQAVFAKLAASLPRRRSGPCPEGTELGMIKRECEKKSRQKAVRQILAESKTLIPALKPCFLMSPLSVAQYLPVDAAPFDLIVFDEASQIPVWDAIGVIARGKQLIVVGDPKQMPPTNFFQKGEAEDDDEANEAIADQESILDECLVAGVFSTYLNWHYRSRHESLIAFSNEHYYSNKLCTFPAATSSPRLGVKFMFVPNGRFVKTGKGPRVNEVEAKALVDYVCEQVLKPDYKKRSIGIVTFSMPQQRLIRDMLEERRAANRALERLLPEDGEGAYFVKNLENVQGDESDVILFSVGYAPDEDDRFTMNFGPLNLTGGERRLNVAVTRAKEQVVVFASIHATQIDAGEDGRTKAVGAGHLKAFLEYAEKVSASQAAGSTTSQTANSEHQTANSFSDLVADFLTDKGYEVDRDVGCSEHRVDIAIRDPKKPGSYIAGIECDGPSYARQRTVQDRDVNRSGVLRGLGWHMFRVWSVDWALDRQRAEQRLLDAITDQTVKPSNDQTIKPSPDQTIKPSPDQAIKRSNDQTIKPSSDQTIKPSNHQTIKTAPSYTLWKCSTKQNSSDFYELKSRQRISKMIAAVIDAEGPVYESTLRKRIAQAWGLSRITENVQRVFDACMPKGYSATEHETGKVFWPRDEKPSEYSTFRIPSANDAKSQRSLDEIPPEELRNAMRQTLDDFGSCPKDDLYREAIKTFGLSTLTSRARRFLDVAYSMLNTPSS